MSNSTIQLSGYFDNNFGDDYMMKIIVNSLNEFDFVIDEKENVNPVIIQEKNVRIEEITKKACYKKLLVTGCGFMINSKAALFTELVFFLKQKHVADYCLGCNMEPLDNCVKKWLIKNKLNKFRLIVCRDKKSYSWLSKNVRKPKIEYLPDILFGMPDEWLPERNVQEILGISLMHRSGDEKDCRYYKEMAKAADLWIENGGRGVILMAFNSGSENDVYSCECVKKLMKHPHMAEIAVHKNGNEIFEAYSRCSKIIGARFHSAVLALKMGVPFFPVIYREKMKNLIEDVEYPVHGCGIDEIDVAALRTFVTDDQVPYHVKEDIYIRANKYAQLFRQSCERTWNDENNGKGSNNSI